MCIRDRQHSPVFRDNIDQHFYDVCGPFKFLPDIIKPVSDAGVGLPWVRQNIRQLALLNIQYTDAVNLRAAILLVIDGAVFAMLLNRSII